MKIFNFHFLMYLHVLGGSKHDLIIFGKCLSVYGTNFMVAKSTDTNGQNVMKFYIWFHLNINWC